MFLTCNSLYQVEAQSLETKMKEYLIGLLSTYSKGEVNRSISEEVNKFILEIDKNKLAHWTLYKIRKFNTNLFTYSLLHLLT